MLLKDGGASASGSQPKLSSPSAPPSASPSPVVVPQRASTNSSLGITFSADDRSPSSSESSWASFDEAEQEIQSRSASKKTASTPKYSSQQASSSDRAPVEPTIPVESQNQNRHSPQVELPAEPWIADAYSLAPGQLPRPRSKNTAWGRVVADAAQT